VDYDYHAAIRASTGWFRCDIDSDFPRVNREELARFGHEISLVLDSLGDKRRLGVHRSSRGERSRDSHRCTTMGAIMLTGLFKGDDRSVVIRRAAGKTILEQEEHAQEG